MKSRFVVQYLRRPDDSGDGGDVLRSKQYPQVALIPTLCAVSRYDVPEKTSKRPLTFSHTKIKKRGNLGKGIQC